MTNPLQLAEPRRTWPAWGLSVALHFVLFLAIGLGLQAAPKSLPTGSEYDRSVGIVLTTHPAAHRQEYFAEGTEKSATPAGSLAQPPPAHSASDDPPLLANLSLPGRAETPVGPDATELTAQPGLRISGKRTVILPGLGDEAILAADVVNQKPAGPSGPPGKLALFGSDAVEGHSFVFVIDRSNSMGDGGLGVLRVAEIELQRALAGLSSNHKFQIIAYNQRVAYFSESGLVEATESSRQAVRHFFTTIGAMGATEHEPALLAALRLKPDVIFLFTDGGDPHLNAVQIDRIAGRTAGRTSIHCLQFGRGPLQEGNNFLQRLANRARGSYGYIDMNQVRRGE